MKIRGLIVITSVIALMLGSCGKSSIQNAKLKNSDDSLSYAFGINIFNSLSVDSIVVDPMMMAKAMLDGQEEKPLMSDDTSRMIIMNFLQKREAEKTAEMAELNKATYKEYIAQNEAFLTENKAKAGVTVTASGLQYEVIKMGTGPKPTAENTVKVHYVGTLIDGTQFDSSVERNEPAQFQVSGVITGWTEALQLMPVGSKFRIWLPESIAYGPNAAGDVIKPFSTLIFEVELLEIVQ